MSGSPQDFLALWVFGCLFVGAALLSAGRARRGGVGRLLGLFCPRCPPERALRGDHLEPLVHGAVILGSLRLIGFGLAGPPGEPMPRWVDPRGAGPGVRHRRRRDAADPPDPRVGGSDLLAPNRTPRNERVLAVRAVMLPGVRGALAPGAALLQRRLPRAAVPGAGVAGVPVIGEARGGGRSHRVELVDRCVRSWRELRLPEGAPMPPDASLDAMSRSEIDRLESSFTGTSGGVSEGIETLNNSKIPFC